MTKTSLTANQPRFSIRTYSLGAASVLLAYACLAAAPVASANTTTNPSTSPTIAQTTNSTTEQKNNQVSQSSTNQTNTTPSTKSNTEQISQEKNVTGTTTSAIQPIQTTTPSTSPASQTRSQQTTPSSQQSQNQTRQTSTNQIQTNTSSTSSSAISQKTNTQTQTNTNRNRLTTQARTTSTRSSSTSALGDDYPYTAVDAIDPWRLYTRQCTSFVAFRLSKVNGFEIPPAYGNADVWGYRAQREGYRVDMSPAVGSVAWWTSPMHVAWVSSIQGDMVEIEEYNYGTRYTYNRRLIHKNSVSGYIHFKDLAGSPVSQTSPAPTQTHTSGLANSGTYTFTQQAPIKNEAKQSSTTLNYYYAGESVRYDRVLTADGYQWISYVSYSGQRRYIPIKQIQTSPTPQQTNKNLPSSGTYTFSSKAVVRNSPSQSASEITYYGAGSSVRYDRVVTSEGRTWISYISYSGARRYIAIP
ncbi:SH3 domain-containing protein [Streptococcus suis]|uniref:SH3 domain-containing protein n=1 Tax=Streptococcus suis TaxID=1307 RepID=UPI000CF71198|nr:SH3 domain-containing protein [Streptococcus suis]HEM4672793.1 SH3 domain-containing protein [Streptococcus suis]